MYNCDVHVDTAMTTSNFGSACGKYFEYNMLKDLTEDNWGWKINSPQDTQGSIKYYRLANCDSDFPIKYYSGTWDACNWFVICDWL